MNFSTIIFSKHSKECRLVIRFKMDFLSFLPFVRERLQGAANVQPSIKRQRLNMSLFTSQFSQFSLQLYVNLENIALLKNSHIRTIPLIVNANCRHSSQPSSESHMKILCSVLLLILGTLPGIFRFTAWQFRSYIKTKFRRN